MQAGAEDERDAGDHQQDDEQRHQHHRHRVGQPEIQNQNIFLRSHVSSTHFSPSSAIFWSACNENISVHCWQEILESWMLKYLKRRENYLCHLCAAIFVSGRSAAEDGDELLSLRTIESWVPATTGVNKPWAVGGAENHCNDHHYYQHYQHQQEVPLLFLSFRNCW